MMKELFMGFVLFIVCPFTVLIALCYSAENISCAQKASKMQMPHDYGFFSECMVQAKDGRWWPIERYTHMSVEE